MASKLQHTVSYPFSTARLWAIYTTEKYWHDLVERMNSGHGHVEKVTITGDTVTGRSDEAQQVFDQLTAIGIDLTDVFLVLENEGVEKFEKSWHELLEATQGQLDEKK